MTLRFLIALVLAATLLSACTVTTGGTVRGSGKAVSRDYAVDGFTEIDANAGFIVTVTGGSPYKVTATTDDNLIDAVSIKKEGTTLRIGVDTLRFSSTSSTIWQVAIVMPELKGVTANGGVFVKNGSPAPAGSTLTVNANGGARVDLGNVQVDKATVVLNGGAQATLNVKTSLSYDLNGGATLRYTGNPTLGNVHTDGGASVTKY